MDQVWISLKNTLGDLITTVESVNVWDILDILMVAFLLYYIIKLVRDTRANQLVKGILLLLVLYAVVTTMPFKAMGFIMKALLQVGAFALVVVFQPELRRMLEKVGRTKLPFGLFSAGGQDERQQLEVRRMIDEVAQACESLSRHRTGALMVFEMQTKLGEIIRTGTVIDAYPSAEMIGNIFYVGSPLHDGAMVIRGARLYAAGCFLPLTENNDLSKELGTRHRASIGMSENSDAIVLVVSEETGVISVARNGVLTRNYTPETLGDYLRANLLPQENAQSEHRLPFRRAKK
ncbi:MAG: TIGR00159 family protein [Clostridiales bacterium]|uniref:Diadenylate cyclase n=1 Tax=Harryflintia acetispora TaxID=1849041 RepID=A0A9X8Y7W9_9FIRM|nr:MULTISPECIES: diadenylate cyclase CdaA [Oscillospiraceae]PWM38528.1 MAG: TIGR00159 family protein [Clostridiales bacterium]RGB64692.1 TIGR00159 family protein [Harryflintia acetispora]TCL42919.1 diadenylate cyclase [Harryflintia acetispora]